MGLRRPSQFLYSTPFRVEIQGVLVDPGFGNPDLEVGSRIGRLSSWNDPASAGGPTGLKFTIPLGLTSIEFVAAISGAQADQVRYR